MWFKNNKGFSLVETLIAIGISSGAALMVYKILGESQKGQIMVENRDDINQFHREIIGKFTDRTVCTKTLMPDMTKGLKEFPITEILNEQNKPVVTVPLQQEKNQALVKATYNHTIAAKQLTSDKAFNIDLSYKDNAFEGCVTRGSLGLDPKDACDLVVGLNVVGKSYYFNGKCNFAQGACEQSGRVWDTENLKCHFSEDDLEALRKEICQTLGFGYSPETSKCLPTQEMIDAVKALKNKENGN
jgi:prepilin-type N-terminal cleavage/methylation domain-containing protein